MKPQLITPQTTISLVLDAKTRNFKLRLYESRLQKYLFWIAVSALVLGIAQALLAYFWKNDYLILSAVICTYGSALLGLAYQISAILPEIIGLKNIEREISNPFLVGFNNDIQIIHELTEVSEIHHLEYACESFKLMSKQLRERIAMLVGALDKVGLIPLITAGYFSYLKAQKDGLETFGGIEWIFTAFAVFFLLALRMTSTAQWMENVSQLYAQALELKLQNNRR